MARLPRLSLPGLPHLLLQRGHNRQPIFQAADDYAHLHGLLVEEARQEAVAVHGYVFMPNHFHLLATPAEEGALARMMQGIGRRYVRHFNQRTGRSGTLWDGRYRGAPLDAEAYLLACMVHLDLHPVRADLVEGAADYAWSSHAHYVGRSNDRLVTPHPLVWALGNTPFARESAYAALVARGLPQATERAITDSVLHGWALGGEAFVAELYKRSERRWVRGRAGRPRQVLSP